MRMYKDFMPSVAVAAAVLFAFAAHTYSQEMDYNTILSLGIQCAGRHSCADGSVNSNFSLRNCECDNQCNTYEDCCIDNEYRSSRSRRPSDKPLYRCVDDRKSRPPTGVYVISKCRSDWNGAAYIRENCERNQDNLTDPVLATPATDSARRKTYRNLYCAECNNVEASDLTPWEVMISCDLNTAEAVTDEYIQNNLVYSDSTGKWGIDYRNDSLSRKRFHECQLGFGLPQSAQTKVRRCRPRVISTCPRSYKRQVVRRQCASYMAVIYTNGTIYKNPHCGMCNGISLKQMHCFQTDLHVTERRTTPMSFTLLFDVNSRDGNRVGSVDRCSNGQTWDSFYKKCRSVVCILPGRTLVNGRCVSQ